MPLALLLSSLLPTGPGRVPRVWEGTDWFHWDSRMLEVLQDGTGWVQPHVGTYSTYSLKCP